MSDRPTRTRKAPDLVTDTESGAPHKESGRTNWGLRRRPAGPPTPVPNSQALSVPRDSAYVRSRAGSVFGFAGDEMFRAKLCDTKQCPSCGWLMRLIVDPESMRQLGRTTDWTRLQRYYQCVNKACEHVERAA